MSIVNFIKNNSVLAKANELIFFGGSFNPWHEGHSSCLRLAPKDWPIIVMPDHNPFKDIVGTNQKLTSVEEIQENLRKIEATTYLFDEYLLKNQKNPSHKWISEVHKNFPHKNISLLMGFDSFISIDRWIKAETILSTVNTLYIASRLDDEKVKKKQIKVLKKVNSDLNVEFIGNHEYEDLSSTKIRENLSQK